MNTFYGIFQELLEEHKYWSKILGHILVRALQKDYEYLDVIARHFPIEYQNGEPYIKSEIIAKIEEKNIKEGMR